MLVTKRCRSASADADTPFDRSSFTEAPATGAGGRIISMKDLLNDPRMEYLSQEMNTKTSCKDMETVEAIGNQANAEMESQATTIHVSTGVDDIKLEEESELDVKCRRLAELIARSKHLVAFTGAGISTSVGIPDYRGEHGIRTKKYQDIKKKNRRIKKRRKQNNEEEDEAENDNSTKETKIEIPPFHSLVPSTTHMALYELHRLGYLKYVVSQNVDNLHLKSGLPAEALTEVHGNATQAKCETCEKVYTTDFPWTGLCDAPDCISTKRPIEQRLRARTRHGNGRLKRHVVGFDEPLGDIDLAIDECEAADVALVLGTSLRVEPFSEMAGEFADSLVIVNLQPTTQKLDRRAEATGVRLFQKCDIVMEKTMKFLLGPDYEIPKWTGKHATSVFIPEHEEENLVNVLAGRVIS